MATGLVLPSAAADVAPTSITKVQLPPPKTNLFTDSRHAMAAARMCADEYFCFSLDNIIDNDANALDSVHEFLENSCSVRVKGRLRTHVTFWKSIGASEFIIDTICRGYIIPFLTTPPKVCFKNNRSALEHPVFVNRAITELITAGSIVECLSPPTVVNPLSVAIQSSGKKRLVLDLRYPNSFLKKCKVKFQGDQDMLTVLSDSPQQYLFSFDIKSGYHHIEIFPDDQQFLGLSWTDHGVVKYFKFTVLQFGLATGPYIFTKLMMRPLVKRWRASACKIVVYLDDGMAASHSFSSCVHQANRVKSDLINSGLVPNDEKSINFGVPTNS